MLTLLAASRVQTNISVCFSNPYFKLILLKPVTCFFYLWIHILLTPLEVVGALQHLQGNKISAPELCMPRIFIQQTLPLL